jgi:thiol-disulfide isomerase/thioredoxin
MSRILISLIAAFGYCSVVIAQSHPLVGKPCPDFSLNHVEDFAKENVHLSDFKGRKLIIDFFAIGCTSCFSSFPKIDEYRRQYGNHIDFLLIGQQHRNIRSIYSRYRDKYKLRIPVSYDSLTFIDFGVYGVPHAVWIDERGIVRAVTNHVSAEDVARFSVNSDAFDGRKSTETEIFTFNHYL